MNTISIGDFRERFKTNADCYQFLINQKWGSGFKCRRCGCSNWYKRVGSGFIDVALAVNMMSLQQPIPFFTKVNWVF